MCPHIHPIDRGHLDRHQGTGFTPPLQLAFLGSRYFLHHLR